MTKWTLLQWRYLGFRCWWLWVRMAYIGRGRPMIGCHSWSLWTHGPIPDFGLSNRHGFWFLHLGWFLIMWRKPSHMKRRHPYFGLTA